jgi:hypothetical protein
MNPHGHWFWWLLTMGVVVWYLTMTGVVAVLGFRDIRKMLKALTEGHEREKAEEG